MQHVIERGKFRTETIFDDRQRDRAADVPFGFRRGDGRQFRDRFSGDERGGIF